MPRQKHSGGNPASSSISANKMAVNGVLLAGLRKNTLPEAIAGAILCATRFKGKLNGLIARIGPIGTNFTIPIFPFADSFIPRSNTSPEWLKTHAAHNLKVEIALRTSALA